MATPDPEGQAEAPVPLGGRGQSRRRFLQVAAAGALALGGGGYGIARWIGGSGGASKTVNVMNHGAVGDGSSDDTGAIASAVSAAGTLAETHGVRVRVISETGKRHKVRYAHPGLGPGGRAAILLPSHVYLDGLSLVTDDPGTTFGGWHVVVSDHRATTTDIGVMNCTVDGGAAPRFNGELTHVGLLFNYSSDLFIYHNYVHNFYSGACNIFPLGNVSRIRVLHNRFDLCNGGSLKLQGQKVNGTVMQDIQIIGNSLRNNLGYPVYVDAENVVLTANDRSQTLTDLTFTNNRTYPTGHGLIFSQVTRGDIGHNLFDNRQYHGANYPVGIGDESGLTSSNVRIHDNMLIGTFNPMVAATKPWVDVDIVDNRFDATGGGTGNPCHIDLGGREVDLTIAGNHFHPTASNANGDLVGVLQLEAGCRGLVIRGNHGWNDVPLSAMNAASRPNWPGQSSGGNVTMQPTVPASGATYANIAGYDAEVSITGGSVEAVAIDGVTTSETSGRFRVPANHSITLTYLVTPTWEWTWS